MPTPPMDEPALIRAAQAGDLAAFGRLMDAHAPALFTLARRVLDDAAEAEDLVQEGMLRAWNQLPSFRAEARLATWLYRIVIHLCFDRLPQLRRLPEAMDDAALLALPEAMDGPEARLGAAELEAALHGAIAALPPQQRLLITLRHLEDLRYDEIASLTGMPLGTVKTGIHRGRRQLRAALSATGLA